MKFLVKLFFVLAGWITLWLYATHAAGNQQIAIAQSRLDTAARHLNQCPDAQAEREVWEANQQLCFARYGTALPAETFDQWQANLHHVCGRSISPAKTPPSPELANASALLPASEQRF